MATPTLFTQIDEMLGRMHERLARLPLAGDLNEEQQANVRLSLIVVVELRRIFAAECARQGGSSPTRRIMES